MISTLYGLGILASFIGGIFIRPLLVKFDGAFVAETKKLEAEAKQELQKLESKL
jgi:hypothetical protein